MLMACLYADTVLPSLSTFSVRPSFSTSASATSSIMASVNQEFSAGSRFSSSSSATVSVSVSSVVSSVWFSFSGSLPTYLPVMV